MHRVFFAEASKISDAFSFWVKNGLEFFWRLSFFGLEFFENVQKISLDYIDGISRGTRTVEPLNFCPGGLYAGPSENRTRPGRSRVDVLE